MQNKNLQEMFALKPIPKDRSQTYRLTNKGVKKEMSEKIKQWKKLKKD